MSSDNLAYRNTLPEEEQNPGSFKVREAGKRAAIEFIYKAGVACLRGHNGKGEIYTDQLRCHIFGSSLFCVDHSESDIDILVIGNSLIHQWIFFKHLKECLQNCHKISQLMDASSATHPAMKFKVNVSSETTSPNPVNVDVDVLYARWHSPVVPECIPIHLPPQDYRNLDTVSLKNINGIRNCKYLLNIIPVHYQVWFGRILTVIRKWAKNQMLFRNSHGMIPGIAWSIMLMKVIQSIYGDTLYSKKALMNAPKLEDSSIDGIIVKFFLFYSEWDWSQPITIHEIRPHDRELETGYITVTAPCYPHHNCVRQTTRLTRNSIEMAFKNMTRLDLDSKTLDDSILERAYTETLEFGDAFQKYIEVGVRATKLKDFEIWRIYFRNQLSLLIKDFDHPILGLKNLLIHPYPRNSRIELPAGEANTTNESGQITTTVGHFDLWCIGINFEHEEEHGRELNLIQCIGRIFLDDCFQKFEKLKKLTEDMEVIKINIKDKFDTIIEIKCSENRYKGVAIEDRLEPLRRNQTRVLSDYAQTQASQQSHVPVITVRHRNEKGVDRNCDQKDGHYENQKDEYHENQKGRYGENQKDAYDENGNQRDR